MLRQQAHEGDELHARNEFAQEPGLDGGQAAPEEGDTHDGEDVPGEEDQCVVEGQTEHDEEGGEHDEHEDFVEERIDEAPGGRCPAPSACHRTIQVIGEDGQREEGVLPGRIERDHHEYRERQAGGGDQIGNGQELGHPEAE